MSSLLPSCLRDVWSPLESAAADLSSSANVIDGDTIEIGDAVVRLADIDAPELGQRCEGPKPIRPCGRLAAEILAGRIEGATVVCKSAETDTYGRHIASCEHNGEDLSTWLVREGYALAFRKYSSRLVGLEEEARSEARGLWQGTVEPPWEFRARRWVGAAQGAPDGCPIKGTISRSGERIYHAPWSQYYARTRIDEAGGKRWFCDEGEAPAAGWRLPQR